MEIAQQYRLESVIKIMKLLQDTNALIWQKNITHQHIQTFRIFQPNGVQLKIFGKGHLIKTLLGIKTTSQKYCQNRGI